MAAPSFRRVPIESPEDDASRAPRPINEVFQEEHADQQSIATSSTTSPITSAGRAWEIIQEQLRVHDASQQENSDDPSGKWAALAFGQFIAIIATSMNASSFTLTDRYGVDTQFFQMFLMYVLLSFNLYWRRREVEPLQTQGDAAQPGLRLQSELQTAQEIYYLPFTSIRLKIPFWIYLLMSLLDVFPNFLALWSFRFTSLTSTTLLGSLTAPATMLFSKYILARLFGGYHYLGVALCLLGGTITVWGDSGDTTRTHSSTGDLLAIGSAILYGFGDTIAEYFSKHVDRFEYLGMLGLFGSIFTGLGALVLEREAVISITQMPTKEKTEVCAIMATYVLSVLFYYLAEAKFLVSSDATLLNLSMQSSNLWAVIFTVVVDHEMPTPTFYIALVFVVSGVFVYEMGGFIRRGQEDDRAKVGAAQEERQERIELSADVRHVI